MQRALREGAVTRADLDRAGLSEDSRRRQSARPRYAPRQQPQSEPETTPAPEPDTAPRQQQPSEARQALSRLQAAGVVAVDGDQLTVEDLGAALEAGHREDLLAVGFAQDQLAPVQQQVQQAQERESFADRVEQFRRDFPSTWSLSRAAGGIRQAVAQGWDPDAPNNERLAARRGADAKADWLTGVTVARENIRHDIRNARQKIRVGQQRMEPDDTPENLARHRATVEEGQRELEEAQQRLREFQQVAPEIRSFLEGVRQDQVRQLGGDPRAQPIMNIEASLQAGTSPLVEAGLAEVRQDGAIMVNVGQAARQGFKDDLRELGFSNQEIVEAEGITTAAGIGPAFTREDFDRPQTRRAPGIGPAVAPEDLAVGQPTSPTPGPSGPVRDPDFTALQIEGLAALERGELQVDVAEGVRRGFRPEVEGLGFEEEDIRSATARQRALRQQQSDIGAEDAEERGRALARLQQAGIVEMGEDGPVVTDVQRAVAEGHRADLERAGFPPEGLDQALAEARAFAFSAAQLPRARQGRLQAGAQVAIQDEIEAADTEIAQRREQLASGPSAAMLGGLASEGARTELLAEQSVQDPEIISLEERRRALGALQTAVAEGRADPEAAAALAPAVRRGDLGPSASEWLNFVPVVGVVRGADRLWDDWDNLGVPERAMTIAQLSLIAGATAAPVVRAGGAAALRGASRAGRAAFPPAQAAGLTAGQRSAMFGGRPPLAIRQAQAIARRSAPRRGTTTRGRAFQGGAGLRTVRTSLASRPRRGSLLTPEQRQVMQFRQASTEQRAAIFRQSTPEMQARFRGAMSPAEAQAVQGVLQPRPLAVSSTMVPTGLITPMGRDGLGGTTPGRGPGRPTLPTRENAPPGRPERPDIRDIPDELLPPAVGTTLEGEEGITGTIANALQRLSQAEAGMVSQLSAAPSRETQAQLQANLREQLNLARSLERQLQREAQLQRQAQLQVAPAVQAQLQAAQQLQQGLQQQLGLANQLTLQNQQQLQNQLQQQLALQNQLQNQLQQQLGLQQALALQTRTRNATATSPRLRTPARTSPRPVRTRLPAPLRVGGLPARRPSLPGRPGRLRLPLPGDDPGGAVAEPGRFPRVVGVNTGATDMLVDLQTGQRQWVKDSPLVPERSQPGGFAVLSTSRVPAGAVLFDLGVFRVAVTGQGINYTKAQPFPRRNRLRQGLRSRRRL